MVVQNLERITDQEYMRRFRASYRGMKVTRKQLCNENQSLYRALQRRGLLDKAIPFAYNGRPPISDEEYARRFHQKFGRRRITRGRLSQQDRRLYEVLRARGLLDKVIPDRGYRNLGCDVLTYFRRRYGRKVSRRDVTRSQLQREDAGLYIALYRRGLLDKAIPSAYNGRPPTPDEEYARRFRMKYRNKKITRGQLRDSNRGLYQALWRRGLLDVMIPPLSKRL